MTGPGYQPRRWHSFPPIHQARPDGLLASGGDLSCDCLLQAYCQGIFPWNAPGEPLLWWSPDPRCLLFPQNLHLSRRLAKTLRSTLRSQSFRFSLDLAFDACITACATNGERAGNSWLTEEMQQAYRRLHQLGFAHSVECWEHGELVGGLYGLAIGRCFCGESMFHRRRDASRMALAVLARLLQRLDYSFIDCQLATEHLLRHGATAVPRSTFLQLLANCRLSTGCYILPGPLPPAGWLDVGLLLAGDFQGPRALPIMLA
ncbi:MAG: leucyl/phenylalanyl-tRNA--protein transferase [Desulfuromonas thiophila]|uniref:leucyl/phenylalanyl-tRNA--protein transferase n=1 Tax=Desulfuromonas thiophila TaxID=57664 RepID=UPI0024A90117|nr:leucyl/phenylalanyl-tRNA--protein transferase [Desulfuromonas thiophila]MDY0397322.1 leucyl/phenylalanyl-tRNA--protein transferase [Desulfuromonas thiophila]